LPIGSRSFRRNVTKDEIDRRQSGSPRRPMWGPIAWPLTPTVPSAQTLGWTDRGSCTRSVTSRSSARSPTAAAGGTSDANKASGTGQRPHRLVVARIASNSCCSANWRLAPPRGSDL